MIGLFQFYGYLGTIFELNGHAHDITRIIWHGYTMTPVHCLAVSMIITGIIQYFLSLNKGYLKYRRNIIIYIVLAIIVVIISQPVWDFCKTIGPDGFPNAHIGDGYPGDYKVFMPPLGASFSDYFKHFFLAICGGSNHPIFPYLAMAFTGNIIGMLMVSASKKEKPNPHMPKYGMLSGILIFMIGIALIPIMGVDFDSILPINAIGDITLIHNGLNGFWIPWWTFLLGGEIILVFLIIRLIEYRGIGKRVAEKTTFFRRFGVPAFSVYAWHRFWAIPAVILISAIAGQPSWESGSITSPNTGFGWEWTILTIILVWVIITLLLKIWEKVGYIGGIEWMIGQTAAFFGKNMNKSKGTTKDKAKWWEHGKMDIKPLFYDPKWINIIEADEEYHKNKSDSKLAFKLSIMGIFIGLFSIFALRIGLMSRKTEELNKINKKAIAISIIGIIFMIIVITIMSVLNLGILGINI